MYTAAEPRQRGVVLVFALLVILLLSLLVSAVMRGSILQLRMVRNFESAVLERQQVLAQVESLLQNLGQEAPPGEKGYISCTGNHRGEECGDASLPGGTEAPGSVRAYIRIVETGRPPPRVLESGASSTVAYRAVHYEVGAISGRTSLVQGVLVLVPRTRQ
jgi:type IV pilus assembly PilX-like protein